MKLPTETISASGSGRRRSAGPLADRKGANLSNAAGTHYRRLCRRRGVDITARLIGQWLSERLGQQFIIENRPGAGSNIATEAVVHAPPTDIRSSWSPPNAVNATLYEKLNFNFIRDIAPVAGIIRVPNVMAVNPSFPAKTVPEFIAYAKANPGKVNMASAGIGIVGSYGRRVVQDDDRHRHGSRALSRQAPAITDLIGGQVQVMFPSLPRQSSTSGPASFGHWQ